MGAALAFSSSRQLAMNEQRMPPFPLLFLLAPDGNLASFYTTNTTPGAPQLTSPPQPVGAAGERKGTNSYNVRKWVGLPWEVHK